VPEGTAATEARLAGLPLPPIVRSGPAATHRFACHNPPTDEEAAAGRPLREGFVPAPRPPNHGRDVPAGQDATSQALAHNA
jgi:hypothetical protein